MSDFLSGIIGKIDLFKKEDVDNSFYNVIFPKHRYEGSINSYQQATRFNKDARVANLDERRMLRLERSVGKASALEQQGLGQYGIGLEYYSSKYLKDKSQVTREEALSAYNEYLIDRETYSGYLEKSRIQMYEMSNMYGSDFAMDDYIEYQGMEKKMVDRNMWQKIGSALTVNYATLSPENKAIHNEFWGRIKQPLSEDFEGKKTNIFDVAKDKGLEFKDWVEYYKSVGMNNAFSTVATTAWMGGKAGGAVAGPGGAIAGAWTGAVAGIAGFIQELSTGDKNYAKEVSRGFYGGIGQTGSIIGQSLMEIDYRMGFSGLVDKLGSIDPEEGITDENIGKAYEADQDYLYDIGPMGMLGDIMNNFGNSISESGKGQMQSMYEGGFQKGWFEWGMSYIPSTIGQVYGMMLIGKGVGKLGIGATAQTATSSSKLASIFKGTKDFLVYNAPFTFMFSASEAWNTRENLAGSGLSEEEIDKRVDKVLGKNAMLMTATGAMPGAYTKVGRSLFKGNKAISYGLASLDMFAEGFEEVMQDKIQNTAMEQEYQFMSAEAGKTFMLGMVGGLFGGIGQIANDKVSNTYIQNVKSYNEQAMNDDKMNSIVAGFESGELDAEEATQKLHERFEEIGDVGVQTSMRLYAQSAQGTIAGDIVNGVKNIADKSKQAMERAKAKKVFIKDDLDLDGLGSKVENGVYIVEKLDRDVNYEENYRITDQVVSDLLESDYSEIGSMDKVNNRIIFTEVPVGFSKKVKEESSRRLTVWKQTQEGTLRNVGENKKTVDSLYKSDVLTGGEYAKLYKNVFKQEVTGNQAVDNKVKDANKVIGYNQLLNSARVNPTKKNLEALKRVKQQIESGNLEGYGTYKKMNEQLVDKDYMDVEELNDFKKIPKEYETLNKQMEEAEKQGAIEKLASLGELTTQIESANDTYKEKLKKNKALKKAVQKDKRKLAGKLEGKVTLGELEIYEMVVDEKGEPKPVQIKVPVKKVSKELDDKKRLIAQMSVNVVVENSVKPEKVPSINEIGTNENESKIVQVRKQKTDKKLVGSLIFNTIKNDFGNYDKSNKSDVSQFGSVVHIINGKKFKLTDKKGKRLSVARQKNKLDSQTLVKDFSKSLVGNEKLVGQVFEVPGENSMDIMEVFLNNINKKGFKGIRIMTFTNSNYDLRVEKNKEGSKHFGLIPGELLGSSDIKVFVNNESKKKIDVDKKKAKEMVLSNMKKLAKPGETEAKRTEVFDKMFEVNFVSKQEMMSAFTGMFEPEYQEYVGDLLQDYDLTEIKEQSQLREQVCS